MVDSLQNIADYRDMQLPRTRLNHGVFGEVSGATDRHSVAGPRHVTCRAGASWSHCDVCDQWSIVK